MKKEHTALIAMSGGVDSSVAAYLMKEAGYECEGTTMRLFHNEDIGMSIMEPCCSASESGDAAAVASKLGIPYEVKDFTPAFKEKVIDKFIHTYESGGTPNPCIDCNRYLKFEKLMDFAAEKGLYYVVTGHYARIGFDEGSGRWYLRKARNLSKDQSYVLWSLTQEQLAHIKFPLGKISSKDETRRIAASLGFVNAQKKESQDICFVPDGDYVKFMESYTGRTYGAGNFIDTSGNVIGRHKGAVHYTIGQRKGLGYAAGHPVYVCAKSMKDNTVTLGEESDLYSRSLTASEINWISIPQPDTPVRVLAKTRYYQQEQPATVHVISPDGSIRIDFDEPQRAITVGQAVVMYSYDGSGIVIGGGTISSAIRS